jgi:hypothetical protein
VPEGVLGSSGAEGGSGWGNQPRSSPPMTPQRCDPVATLTIADGGDAHLEERGGGAGGSLVNSQEAAGPGGRGEGGSVVDRALAGCVEASDNEGLEVTGPLVRCLEFRWGPAPLYASCTCARWRCAGAAAAAAAACAFSGGLATLPLSWRVKFETCNHTWQAGVVLVWAMSCCAVGPTCALPAVASLIAGHGTRCKRVWRGGSTLLRCVSGP